MFTFINLVIAVVLIAVMVIRGGAAITLVISSTTQDSLGLILQLVVASQGSYRMSIYKVQDKVIDRLKPTANCLDPHLVRPVRQKSCIETYRLGNCQLHSSVYVLRLLEMQ